jgi:hypothetical protein
MAIVTLSADSKKNCAFLGDRFPAVDDQRRQYAVGEERYSLCSRNVLKL